MSRVSAVPPPRRARPGGIAWRPPALVLILSIVAPLLNVIPTIEGALREHSADQVYLGFRWMIGDHVQYGSFSRQGEAGRLLMENMFTTEPQRPSYVLLYFNIVGLSMRLTGLSFPVVWEVLRVLFGFGMLVAAWWFVGFFWEDRGRRILAWLLIAFSGGLYYLASLLPEGALSRPGYPFLTDPAHFQWNWSTFSSMLVALWIPPLMLLLAASILVLHRRAGPAPARWWALFAMGPLVWFIHPHSGNVAYLAFGLLGLAPVFRALWNLEPIPLRETLTSVGRVMPFILSFIVVFLYLRWASQDAVFAAGGRAGAEWNPWYSPFWYPLVYGLLIPFALFGIRWSATLPERPRHLILALLASSFLLSVNPLFAGVKHQFLMHLPLAVLAAHGIFELRERSAWVRKASRGALGFVVAGGLLLHGPITIVRDMMVPLQEPYAWVARAEAEAASFLDAQPPGNVLCGYRACGTVAYLGAKKVFTGHWLLTLNQQQKRRDLAAFLNPAVPPNGKRDLLREHQIRYVFIGPVEQRMGSVDPALELDTIYDKGGVVIYKVY